MFACTHTHVHIHVHTYQTQKRWKRWREELLRWMAQRGKVLAAKLDNQSWVRRIHMVEEPTPESCHVCTMAHILTYIHYICIYIIIKIHLIFNSSKNKKADKMPQNT